MGRKEALRMKASTSSQAKQGESSFRALGEGGQYWDGDGRGPGPVGLTLHTGPPRSNELSAGASLFTDSLSCMCISF